MKRKWITFGRVLHTGVVNFIRNASLAIAAMAVMVVTLTIVLFSLITNATLTNTIDDIASKVDVSVFLKDSVTEAQGKELTAKIKQQPSVQSVEYLSKEQALAAYVKQNANNQALSAAATLSNNPIPATIHVKPKELKQLGALKNYLTSPANLALQTEGSPSYSGDRQKAIDNITKATEALRMIGIIAVIVFAVVSALIIFNTIQMAIFNRRDEIQIMRLLGASSSYIRGPFIVESVIYGVLSAVISVLIINATFAASSGALQASSLGLLDINYASQYFTDHFLRFLAMQIGVGVLIGAVSSFIATRRYLKFKTK
ncbi:ABC transporter permease [Candidatus Saccharibacteria bacterium]|nr:ABC transporter permease [Candidatus Saccharibacteria bacterium]HPG37615.1 permease-like cell division protein FtsX [Candidatus Saccharibacteria bacterium]